MISALHKKDRHFSALLARRQPSLTGTNTSQPATRTAAQLGKTESPPMPLFIAS
jgi:hypothetical protein